MLPQVLLVIPPRSMMVMCPPVNTLDPLFLPCYRDSRVRGRPGGIEVLISGLHRWRGCHNIEQPNKSGEIPHLDSSSRILLKIFSPGLVRILQLGSEVRGNQLMT